MTWWQQQILILQQPKKFVLNKKEGASSSLLLTPPVVPDRSGTYCGFITYLVDSLFVSMDFDAPGGTIFARVSFPGLMACAS
jgi:hypothetical protein